MNTESNMKQYNSTYAGTVVTNIDPLKQGRLLVQVPDVLGADPCIWAVSASPIASIYTIPMPGDGVWIIFRDGDPNYAIWIGSWRGSPIDVPPMALAAPPVTPPIVLQSISQNKIIISSVPGDGITLETAAGPTGPSIKVTPVGIYISSGPGLASITLTGKQVIINEGALMVQ